MMLRGPNSLQTLPLEILDNIFCFACIEKIDLTLLRVSRDIQWKLREHPLVKVLQSFCSRQEFFQLFGFCLEAEPELETLEWVTPFEKLSERDIQPQRALSDRPWCTPGLITWIQLVLIKRTIMDYWIPLLERDGCKGSAISCRVLRKLLKEVVQKEWDAAEDDRVDDIVVIDSNSRYSWTRLHVWPRLGRIVIRDQLSNTTLETKISLLAQISS